MAAHLDEDGADDDGGQEQCPEGQRRIRQAPGLVRAGVPPGHRAGSVCAITLTAPGFIAQPAGCRRRPVARIATLIAARHYPRANTAPTGLISAAAQPATLSGAPARSALRSPAAGLAASRWHS